jgi:hypothetical protein
VTQVAEREELRASLYHTAIDLLGGRAVPSLPRGEPRPAVRPAT